VCRVAKIGSVVAALGLALAGGCGENKENNPPAVSTPTGTSSGAASQEKMPANEPKSITVYVAASTQDAVKAAAESFQRDTGVEVKISAAGSNTLANQIVNGAPAELFLSADEEWADFVKEKGFAAQTKQLLGNRLVLAVPQKNPAGVKTPEDLLSPKVERVALAGENVPAGIYAKQSLTALKLYDELVQDKKIVRGMDVRATLNLVELGEVAAAIVYKTDAMSANDVETVYTFDDKSHEPIRYPLVLLKRGETNSAAQNFFDYLASNTAAKIFEKDGFSMLK
jgi:molybdate transport system substrate-binding protein